MLYRSSGQRKNITQGYKGSGPDINTTPGCNVSGPELYRKTGKRMGSGPRIHRGHRGNNTKPKQNIDQKNKVIESKHKLKPKRQLSGGEIIGMGLPQPKSMQSTWIDQKQLITDTSTIPNNKETPINPVVIIPKRLFGNKKSRPIVNPTDKYPNNNITEDIEEMNVEILLLNTLIITAVKIQTEIENFIKKQRLRQHILFH